MSNTNEKLIVIRNAKVDVGLGSQGGEPCLKLTVYGKDDLVFTHTFDPRSKQTKEVFESDMDTLIRKYNGKHYAFSQSGELVDYRTTETFVQSDEAIERLSEIVGMKMTKTDGKYQNGVNGLYDSVRSRATNGALFGGEADPFHFDVDELGEGGNFSASLMSKWSVFSPNIELSLNVKRLVCTNGMVANSPFVTRAVPVINNWEDNMRVVHAQLEPHMSGILQDRFREMANQSASVATLKRAHDILNGRVLGEGMTDEDRRRILRMADIVDPKAHLGDIYTDRVFSDQRAAHAMGGHLTQFDVFNVITEASSHYGRDSQTDGEATMLLNRIMFDELKSRSVDTGIIKPSTDSDPSRAFFGTN